MTQTDQHTTGKAAATAKKMLADRIALVTTLGNAIDDHDRAGVAVTAAKTAQDTAATTTRTALVDAIAGGWTATELRNTGLVVPAGPRRKRAAVDGVEVSADNVHNQQQ